MVFISPPVPEEYNEERREEFILRDKSEIQQLCLFKYLNFLVRENPLPLSVYDPEVARAPFATGDRSMGGIVVTERTLLA